MARYHLDNRMTGTQQNLSTSYKTLVSVRSSSPNPRRGRLVGISFGADSASYASTDTDIVYTVQRLTGTDGLSATPASVAVALGNPNNPADAASLMFSQMNFTGGEPSVATPVFTRALNQRASMQWNFPDQDGAIYWAATAANGTSGLGLMGQALSQSGGYAAPA